MAASGTKDWFLEEWTEHHIKEIQQYDILSKKEEQEFCHTAYSHYSDPRKSDQGKGKSLGVY